MIVPGIGGPILGGAGASGNEAIYDPSDLATMFQDAAGTIPVTASGQPVGRINDKSGRGNHLTQSTSSKRPTFMDVGGYRWLDFDGVDDALVRSGTGFTFNQPDDIAVGLWFDDLAHIQHVYDNFDQLGRQVIFSNGGSDLLCLTHSGSNVAGSVAINTGYVMFSRYNGTSSFTRLNGVAGAMLDTDSSLVSFSLGAMQNSGNYLNGRIFGVWMRDPMFSAGEMAGVEAWINARTP